MNQTTSFLPVAKTHDVAHPPAPYPRPAYAWYVVSVLTLAYMFSFLDRQIVSMMIGPIKRDFGLTDTQVGLLGGTAFALFYTFFGLPVGRWADTWSRRGLIAEGRGQTGAMPHLGRLAQTLPMVRIITSRLVSLWHSPAGCRSRVFRSAQVQTLGISNWDHVSTCDNWFSIR